MLLEKWTKGPQLTAEVFDVPNALVSEVAYLLGNNLEVYNGYYSIDAIFFTPQDRVHCGPLGQTWVQNIRIGFEHENYFNSGLFKEVSHLLITRAELRVLVSYPNNEDELMVELTNLAQVIRDSDLAENPSLLIIVGLRVNLYTDILWKGYVFHDGFFHPLNS